MQTPKNNQKKLVKTLFSHIAPWYDFLNRTLSLGIDIYWRKRLIKTLDFPQQKKFLDLACGTFDIAINIVKQQPSSFVAALDYTLPMLLVGRKKIRDFQEQIAPVQANAQILPFADNTFDAVTIAFGLRNISPRTLVYEEVLRVLKSGGSFHVLEFGSSKQKIWAGVYNFYLHKLLPWIGGIVSKNKEAYSYLAQSVQNFPYAWQLALEMKQAGFNKVTYFPLTSGIVYLHIATKT
ncbi:MAG: bifunctional demethylmenaquinone methyltransferase/2-methoxy-6-polyprenyl-1,4-benzoquinol methylase UbiE [Desulfonauticus sp.]|nr:bifunctional demethylmenaquinone methyltransferase/2-methoxy-6-polyprenyl-1,4-benzoquinol methylase UbiE [Desulfonauticus sp.]